MLVIALVALVVSMPFIAVLASRPIERRLALRYPIRRPFEALLVVLGSLLGTAIITGSLIVGDTIDRSIRSSAFDQLGPVDELVAASGIDSGGSLVAQFAGFTSPEIDGMLSLTTVPVAVSGRFNQPRAQIIELDFATARAFGGSPGLTGIVGDNPPLGRGAVTRDLAERAGIATGDSITVYAYGRALPLVVDRILPRTGIAGFWRLDVRQQSYNVLVGPGTIGAALAGIDPTDPAVAARLGALGLEPPTTYVAFSNIGGVESGADRTDAAVAAITARVAGTDVRVQPVKRDLLDNAAAAADSLTQLYFTVGMFAVAAGILLLVNIFVMLSDERRSEMGMMRALGLRRSPLVGAIATEGWMYSVVASAVGALIGIGVGRVIAWRADSILASDNDLISLNLTFSFTWTTVLTGFVIGLVISMSTILATSVRVSRLNVIAAIRDLPATARVKLRRRWSTVGALSLVIGVVWTAASLATDEPFGVVVGPMIAVMGAALWIARRVPTTKVTPIAAIVILSWAASFVAVLGALDIDVSITMFLVQGLGMAGAAVALVATQQERIGHAMGRAAGGSLPVRIALAYPTARRFRTAMTLGMFAVVVLTLVYLAVLSHMFSNQVDTITADSSGGFGIVVDSNPTDPLTAEQLRTVPGVGEVAAMTYGLADFARDDRDAKRWPVTGFDADLLTGPPTIDDLGTYPNADAAWRAVLADPDLVIVDDLFLATPGGPQTGTPRVGDDVIVIDPVSGRQRALTVAAITKPDFVGSGAWYGIDGYRRVFGDRSVPSRFYVAPASGDVSAEQLVQTVRRTFVAQGADAETVRARVDTILAQNAGFFTLMEQFVGVGLIVGIAGIGVLLVRAVRERRRDIGVLRSIGFTSRQVSRTFLIEASFIAFEGVAIGIATALIGCYALVASSNNFAEGFEWSVPWTRIAFIAALAFGSAAAMALWPARRAAAIRPAVALRIAD